MPAGYPAGAYYYPTGAALANNAVWNATSWFSEGISSYQGVAADVNRRFGHGLQFRGVYTFSKALDDGDNMNTSVATTSPAFVANPLQPKADYGRASFDVRNSAVVNATYDLPFGPGDKFRERPWLQQLIGRCQLCGIQMLQSGLPFTPQLSYNPSNDGYTRNPVRPSWNPNFSGPVITGGPSIGLLPVRFGQRVQLPAGGSNDSSCGSKGAWDKSKRISLSIRARSSRTVTASAFRSFKADAVEW